MPAHPLQRVCYVEDDEDIRKIVRMSLERVGKLTVEVVGDPLVAIDAMKTFKPDLVMLDWMMPGMDGPTLYRRMREVPEVRDIPVVFITAKASEKELNELRALGAAGTISKPFSPKDMAEQLRSIWASLP
ncbi:MAG: response regulator [Betaproteobacteria bacterium]|nr:response regulator [Betaproteobacteria bacterium]MDH5222405.1 response regulator [Betaproteobacteria bacterium]MDH5351497.1 response regulator [Betaproteobacteria bacterium]